MLHVPSAEAMRALGAALGATAEAGDLFLLRGPFGAGKTTLVQGLARGLGVPDPVTSPSFVLETQYRGGRLPLYHVDLYRLERVDPAFLEALEQDLLGDGVGVVEWPDLVLAHFASDAAVLTFRVLPDDTREIRLSMAVDRVRQAAARWSQDG